MTNTTELLHRWVIAQAGDAAAWAEERLEALAAGAAERDLHVFLGLAPRRLGKADLSLSPEDLSLAESAHPGWRPVGWSVDGAARVLALIVHHGQRSFAERFKDLRCTADVAELIALYRGLPLYPDPEALEFEVGEGLRSNLKPVFEAIAHDNPFPRDNFDDHRWNHMVLKALFVGSRLHPVIGLDARANDELARILRELAQERWAAGRPVSPELWRCVGPFAAAEGAMADIERAFNDGPLPRKAVALSLKGVDHPPARALVDGSQEAADVASGALTWESVDAEMKAQAEAAPRAPVLPNAEIV